MLILFHVAASNFFGAVFSRLGTPMLLTKFLLFWDISATWILLVIMALSAGGAVRLFPERSRVGMGSERYLFWHDAIHGYSGDQVDPDLCVPANCSLAANIVLRRITY